MLSTFSVKNTAPVTATVYIQLGNLKRNLSNHAERAFLPLLAFHQ